MKREKLTQSAETITELSDKLLLEGKLKKDFLLPHIAIFLKDVMKNNKGELKKCNKLQTVLRSSLFCLLSKYFKSLLIINLFQTSYKGYLLYNTESNT